MAIIKRKLIVIGKRRSTRVTALFDSGAETTFITEKLASTLGLPKYRKTFVNLADRTRRSGYESVMLVKINKRSFPVKVVVTSGLGKDTMIVGVDFMQNRHITIDFENHKVKVKKPKYDYAGYRL